MQTSTAAKLPSALSGEEYDRQWRVIDDFILHHPGARHRRRLMFDLISRIQAASLLDVGCGNGELLALIHQSFPSMTLHGADLSSEVVEQNRRRYPSVEFDTLNIEQSRLPQQFDLVVSSEVIEHLDDRGAAFANMVRMVKPNGHLLVSSPSGKIFETERRWGHTTHPTAAELQRIAADLRLEVRYLANWGFPFYYALKYATNVNTDWAMENFGRGNYSRMQKLLCKLLYWGNFLNLPDSRWGCQLVCLMRKTGGN